MASTMTAKVGYRKAKCCLTCSHCKNSFCGILCMSVNQYCVCNAYNGEQGRAARKTECRVCMFGPNGDQSCETGMHARTAVTGCFSGKRISRRNKTPRIAGQTAVKKPRAKK